jgi:hypothetical protein
MYIALVRSKLKSTTPSIGTATAITPPALAGSPDAIFLRYVGLSRSLDSAASERALRASAVEAGSSLGEYEGLEHVGASFVVGRDNLQQVRDGNHPEKTSRVSGDEQVENTILFHHAHALV